MITNGQITANNTAQSLLVIPPGPCTVVLANAGTVVPAYAGVLVSGGTLTSSNGFPLPASGVPVSFAGYQSTHAGTIAVVTAGTVTTNVAWMLSRP